jgi:formylglycine-generating enzyme required for sulfatase activity
MPGNNSLSHGFTLAVLLCAGAWMASILPLAGKPPEHDTEFRHALLMDASGNKANADEIGRLKKILQGNGFLVTHLPNAERDGYPAYERFIRSLPARGKSILYYCGDIDIVKNKESNRSEYHYRLGSSQFIPPDGYPGHNAKSVTEAQLLAKPVIPERYIDGRMAKIHPTASSHQLVLLDIQSFNDPLNPASTHEKRLNGGRFLGFKPSNAKNITLYLANGENTGAILAEKLRDAFISGKDIEKNLSRHGLRIGEGRTSYRLEGRAAAVISPPTKLTSGRKAGDQWLDSHGICFLWCPAGSFRMGWDKAPDAQPKEVTISKGFWMSKYELTRHQGSLFGLNSKGGTANHPLQVSDGNRLAHRIRNQGLYMQGLGRGFPGWNYDLPTEAEWEYAARSGNQKHAPASFNKMGAYANFADNSLYGSEGIHGKDEHLYAYRGSDDGVGLGTAEVGTYHPNAWGFHDMLGNLAEFCADFYKGDLDGGTDPLDLYLQSDRKIHQRNKVYRGGAWCTTPNLLHYAYRGFSVPRSSSFLGVRLVIRQGDRRSRTVEELHAALKGKNTTRK